MRHVVVCDVGDQPAVIAEARRRVRQCSERVIVLSPRRGPAFETDDILNIPIQFALADAGLPSWAYRHRLRKAIALTAGLGSARFFYGIEDLLMNIEACDPDVIDLRNLGSFGRRLQVECSRRFPGRGILTLDATHGHDGGLRWRSYDPKILVTIVLPVHNGEKYLKYSIESCLGQTHQNFELIIVDDGSTDSTSTIIERYTTIDYRIKHITNITNLGLPESLNVGFQLAKGHFLTWTSDDNLYAPSAIQYMVQQLCTFTKVGLVYCGAHHIDETGNRTHTQLSFPPTALARQCVVSACFLYRREVMDAIGLYRPAYRLVEDWDFFIRACLKFPAKFYFEPCYFYRKHAGSLTNVYRVKWKALRKKLLREHFGSGHKQLILPGFDQVIPSTKA